MDLRLHKGLLLVNHLSAIKMFDYKTFQVTDSHNLQLGESPLTFSAIAISTNEFCLFRKLANYMEASSCKLDVVNKKFT